MSFRITSGILLAAWAIASVSATGAQEPQAAAAPAASTAVAPTSVLQGVYSTEQAKRGEALYADTCASCHGDRLAGGEMAPPLSGPDFLANWDQQPLSDLYVRVHEDMPQDNAGTLTPAQAADAVAFVLSANQFPAGTADLVSDKDVLQAIKIETPK
ncbi:MAG: cytochrome c [Acidobacteria bacterium]|nr:cytochrome c [Acidobacteriota bacterium]